MGARAAAVMLLALGLSAPVLAEPLTSDQAVGMALSRNRDVIAARFDIEAAELDRVAARVYPNPVLAYSVGNLVLGGPNPQGETPPVNAGFFGQTVHTVSVAAIIDVWDKRHARMRTAEQGLAQRRLLVEDALREIVYAVRTAFNDVVGETADLALVRDNRARYADTIRISRARRDAGDISEAELRKIELEGLRYENGVIDEEMQLDLARQRLAALLALGPEAGFEPVIEEPGPRHPVPLEPLVEQAMRDRPDYRSVRAARGRGEAAQSQAHREALPDISLGVGFTHSEFQVSGDNPNALGLSLSLPLPLFDRNQANVGRAGLDIRRADNEAVRLTIQIRHEVADGARRVRRASALLDVYEGGGGMLQRAETALQVAERSYRAGALSLLELLEAQRTFIETRERYLKARHDHRQATIDLVHSVAGDIR